ncbi:hypothetical protein [Pseudonocardia alni]|uniref:hypothetical protein n=1 Tax=Pseudonocardia alni TaxID=33907 RepID=UPI00280BEC53|nr:hypothetical protein [Pseudonocardia alni]
MTLSILTLSSSAWAGGTFENGKTSLIIRNSGQYVGTVEIAIWTGSQKASYHGRVWWAGGSANTPSEYTSWSTYRRQVSINRVLPVGSQVCAEGFYYLGAAGYRSIGRPCATIGR